MGIHTFFQKPRTNLPKSCSGQKDFVGFKSPDSAAHMVIYLIRGPEKLLISSCASESVRITWNKNQVCPSRLCPLNTPSRHVQCQNPRPWSLGVAQGLIEKAGQKSVLQLLNVSQEHLGKNIRLASLLSKTSPTHSYTHTHHPQSMGGHGPVPHKASHFWRCPGSGRGKQGAVCWNSGDAGSRLPPCCAVRQGPFAHHWENWDTRTPADLLAQNSQACEGRRISWVPWDQLPRHPLTNRHRWTQLVSTTGFLSLEILHRHISIRIPPGT